MPLSSIESDIAAIEQDTSLREEKNFDKRAYAIDFIEFHFAGQSDSRAEKIKSELEAIDALLFERLQSEIRSGKYKGNAFRELIGSYFDLTPTVQHREGYDNLDIFINRLLSLGEMPEQTKDLQPEMVYYQKTPARLVFELTEKIRCNNDDVFVDIGSGLGQAGILINLLTGCKTIGIEFEPAFCKYANDCAQWLNLPGVSSINTDARKADYYGGNIFFMYTPFWGEMLEQVLERLRKRSLKSVITIITYGPCTPDVARQNWLRITSGEIDSITIPAIFCSL